MNFTEKYLYKPCTRLSVYPKRRKTEVFFQESKFLSKTDIKIGGFWEDLSGNSLNLEIFSPE